MAGRFPHSIGLGSHAAIAMGFPGYNAMVPPSAKSVVNYLQEAGYITYALGKWDHTPLYEDSQVGQFDRWPSSEGFNHAYTFMAVDVHQFIPVMWNNHTPEPYRKTELKFNFIKTKAFGGTGELYVKGNKVAEQHMPRMHISTYSLAETFDIGQDTGTQVSRIYDDPFPFVGELDRVVIKLSD